MRSEHKYWADDGTEFGSEYDCRVYEDKLKQPKREILKDYIVFFNMSGEVMPYSSMFQPTYVYFKKYPDTDEVREVWNEVVDERIDDAICGYNDAGWYFEDEYEAWKSLAWAENKLCSLEKKVFEMEDKFIRK